MLLFAVLKNQLKQEKTRRIQQEKVEQAARDTVAGLTAAANGVVNAVNLEYNDWSGDAAAYTEISTRLEPLHGEAASGHPSSVSTSHSQWSPCRLSYSRYKHLKYVESSVVTLCYVYRRRNLTHHRNSAVAVYLEVTVLGMLLHCLTQEAGQKVTETFECIIPLRIPPDRSMYAGPNKHSHQDRRRWR